MANPYFQFKQFTVWHDRCAMKVGTDAVLLGSWVRVEGAKRMLDIGCGSGLIALMVAQRNAEARVVGVEIDQEAASQAAENVARSPWHDRIRIVCQDILEYTDEEKFDVVFSNPPYFVSSLKCPDKKRASARHADGLSFESLVSKAASLLSENGEFSLVVPSEASHEIKAICLFNKLFLWHETQVVTKRGVEAKRVLLSFRRAIPTEEEVRTDQLVMESSPGQYSERYAEMVKDFYLR